MCKPIWNTGSVVIMNSGFCILDAIIALKQTGVFSSALIKKRPYWPKYIKGDDIDTHFANIEVGECEALPGKHN